MINSVENIQSFYDLINEKKMSLVYFWATWCYPCKKFAPQYQEIANELQDITMLKIDIDEEKFNEVVINYGIQSLPTIIVFFNGKEIDREIGVPLDLKNSINHWLEMINNQ